MPSTSFWTEKPSSLVRPTKPAASGTSPVRPSVSQPCPSSSAGSTSRLERVEAGHPEQSGRHERRHHSLNQEVGAADRREQQRELNRFCQRGSRCDRTRRWGCRRRPACMSRRRASIRRGCRSRSIRRACRCTAVPPFRIYVQARHSSQGHSLGSNKPTISWGILRSGRDGNSFQRVICLSPGIDLLHRIS